MVPPDEVRAHLEQLTVHEIRQVLSGRIDTAVHQLHVSTRFVAKRDNRDVGGQKWIEERLGERNHGGTTLT